MSDDPHARPIGTMRGALTQRVCIEGIVSRLVVWLARVPLRPLVILLAVGIGLMAVMGIGAVLLDRGNLWFDLDSEIEFAWPITDSTMALPALWSGLLLIGAAVAWLAVWRTWPRDRSRPLVLVMSLFFLLVSGDELAFLHERLEKRLGIDWQVLYALPVLLMVIALVVVGVRSRRIDPRASRLLLTAIGAWAVSQVLELVQWRGDEQVGLYVPLMVIEELLEAVGSGLFLVAGLMLVKALVDGDPRAGDQAIAAGAGQAVGT